MQPDYFLVSPRARKKPRYPSREEESKCSVFISRCLPLNSNTTSSRYVSRSLIARDSSLPVAFQFSINEKCGSHRPPNGTLLSHSQPYTQPHHLNLHTPQHNSPLVYLNLLKNSISSPPQVDQFKFPTPSNPVS